MFQALVTSQSGYSTALGCGEILLEASLYVQVDGPDRVREEFDVKGRYIQTCLGSTLDTLAMCNEPMQFMRLRDVTQRDREQDEAQYRAGQSPVPLPLPKEIWWLVDLLWRKRSRPARNGGSGARGTWRWIDEDARLFMATGDLELVEVVQECIDTGATVPDSVDALATASCLIRLLRSLEEPVVPFWAYNAAIEAGRSRDPANVTALLTKISPLHANVFVYIIRLLREMPSVKSGQAIQEIAEIFGEALLSPDKSRTGRDLRDRAAFVRPALKHEKDAPYSMIVFDIARSSLHLGGRPRSASHHGHHPHRGGHDHRQEHKGSDSRSDNRQDICQERGRDHSA